MNKAIIVTAAVILGIGILRFLLKRFLAARANMSFALSVCEGDFETAKAMFHIMASYQPRTFGRNPSICTAAVDYTMLRSRASKKRLSEFFQEVSRYAQKKAPKSPYTHLLSAGLASQQNPADLQWQTALSNAIALAKRDLNVYRIAGEIHAKNNNFSLAHKIFSTTLDIAALQQKHREFVAPLTLDLVRLCSDNGHHDEAIKYLLQALANEPDSEDRHMTAYLLANEYALIHDTHKAFNVLSKGMTAKYKTPEQRLDAIKLLHKPFLIMLGRLHDFCGQEAVVKVLVKAGIDNCLVELAEARIAIDRAKRCNYYRSREESSTTDVTNKTTDILDQTIEEHKKEAKEHLKLAMIATQRKSSSFTQLPYIADYYMELGCREQALAALERAVAQEDKFVDNLAQSDSTFVFIDLHSPGACCLRLEHHDFPFTSDRYSPVSMRLDLAQLYAKVGRYEDAAAEYRKLLKVHSANPLIYLHMVECLDALQNTAEADTLFHKACDLTEDALEKNPNNYNLLIAAALIANRRREYAKSLDYFCKAEDSAPGLPRTELLIKNAEQLLADNAQPAGDTE